HPPAAQAVNARQIIINEARKHGRAYWVERRGGGEPPWPLIFKERRNACLRTLSFLNAAIKSAKPPTPAAQGMREAVEAIEAALTVADRKTDIFDAAWAAVHRLRAALSQEAPAKESGK